jgi:hypothetical protein
MPHRKLVKIGEAAKLPTIQEFFTQMAEVQGEEIRRLKAEIAGRSEDVVVKSVPKDPRKPVPDPWLLHPVRIKRADKNKTGTKKAGKKTAAKRATKSPKTSTKKKPIKRAKASRKR